MMNKPHSSEPVRQRRGIWYRLPERMEAFTAFYTRMFPEDVSLTIMPIGGRSRRADFRVSLSPDHKRAKRQIIDGLSEGHHRHSLEHSISEFFRTLAQEICIADRAIFEIVYLQDPIARQLVGFELAFIHEAQVIEKGGQVFQSIPRKLADERQVPERIELDKQDLIFFEAPAEFKLPLKKLRENLVELDRLHFPILMREAHKGNVPYDFNAHRRAQELALVETVKDIGWTARGSFSERINGSYFLLHSLRFQKFQIRLREEILSTLNEALRRIGTALDFKVKIEVKGLPIIKDVEIAMNQLSSGGISFQKLMEPFTSG